MCARFVTWMSLKLFGCCWHEIRDFSPDPSQTWFRNFDDFLKRASYIPPNVFKGYAQLASCKGFCSYSLSVVPKGTVAGGFTQMRPAEILEASPTGSVQPIDPAPLNRSPVPDNEAAWPGPRRPNICNGRVLGLITDLSSHVVGGDVCTPTGMTAPGPVTQHKIPRHPPGPAGSPASWSASDGGDCRSGSG